MYEEIMYRKEAKKKAKGFIKTKELKTLEKSIFLRRYKTNKTVTVKRMQNFIYCFNLQVLKFSSEYIWAFSGFHGKLLQSSLQEVPYQ